MIDKSFGLDIGTQNVRVSSLDSQRFLSEKNVITIKNNKLILGCGNDAYEMFEKAPENVEVCFPASNGVISDIYKEKLVLEYVYKKINYGKLEKNSTFLIAVPNGTTEVEKRAFYDIIEESKIRPRNISMIDQAVADSISCHIDIDNKNANLIINIGADTTDISVISEGGIVQSKHLLVAGNQISEAIIAAVRAEHGKLIGMKMADQLKIGLADLDKYAPEKQMTVFCRQIATGLPVKTEISSATVNKAVAAALAPIVDNIRLMLERIPSEMTSDIRKNGVYLVGGTANLTDIDVFLRKEITLPVRVLKDPSNSTIRGVTRALSSENYDRLRYFPEENGFF